LSINYSNYDHYGEIGKQYKQKHGQFMTHEAFEHAILVYALTEAMNKAQSTDPEKISAALHEIRFSAYPAKGLPGGVVSFDAKGLNPHHYPLMVQWQKGELVTVWPKSDALAKPLWVK
jgi:branched-chain amino acid transport system substrate-binding protein